MVLRRAAPTEFWNHAGAIFSVENLAPERNQRLERTRTDAIFVKVNVKTNFKLQIM
jgi:hypothetical protein